MCITRSDGTPIWQRGGRVKDLSLETVGADGDDSPSGALARTAETLRKGAKHLRELAAESQGEANLHLENAKAKEAQADELTQAAEKLRSAS